MSGDSNNGKNPDDDKAKKSADHRKPNNNVLSSPPDDEPYIMTRSRARALNARNAAGAQLPETSKRIENNKDPKGAGIQLGARKQSGDEHKGMVPSQRDAFKRSTPLSEAVKAKLNTKKFTKQPTGENVRLISKNPIGKKVVPKKELLKPIKVKVMPQTGGKKVKGTEHVANDRTGARYKQKPLAKKRKISQPDPSSDSSDDFTAETEDSNDATEDLSDDDTEDMSDDDTDGVTDDSTDDITEDSYGSDDTATSS